MLVNDNCGAPVSDVTVTGTFTGDFSEKVSSTTGADGKVILTTSSEWKKPNYTFCVDSLDNTLPYDSDDNVETCDVLN